MAAYILLRLLRPICERAPRGLLSAAAWLAGTVAFCLVPQSRRAVQSNLAQVHPELSARRLSRLAHAVFVHGALGYVELAGLGRLSHEEVVAAYPPIDIQGLDEAIGRGKGVIMVGAHVGPISIGGQMLLGRGAPVTAVVEPIEPPELLALVNSLRGQHGLQMTPIGPRTVRDLLTRLRHGEALGMVADRDVAGTGEIVPFFGTPTRMTTAPATLARRTGAAVVACAAFRTGLWTGYTVFRGPVELPHTADVSADVRDGTRIIIGYLEDFIRACPEQWVVFSPIWGQADLRPAANPQTDAEQAE